MTQQKQRERRRGGSENAMWEESRSETSNRTERTEEEEFGGQLRQRWLVLSNKHPKPIYDMKMAMPCILHFVIVNLPMTRIVLFSTLGRYKIHNASEEGVEHSFDRGNM